MWGKRKLEACRAWREPVGFARGEELGSCSTLEEALGQLDQGGARGRAIG